MNPDGWSTLELMSVAIARDLADGEVVVMGAVPAVPLSACLLAKATHAPGLSYIVGGSGTVNPAPPELPASSCDPALAAAPVTLPLPDIVLLEGRGDALDVFCAGGIQVDAYGNCNLIAVGNWEKPALRGPGTVGLPFLPAVKRSIIYTVDHSPRTFVERVDFVSGPGHPSRPDEHRPYRRLGPTLVVTPKATLGFAAETRRMYLRSAHPGVSEDEVREATGFELAPGPTVEVTRPPSDDELELLRSFDPSGVLRR